MKIKILLALLFVSLTTSSQQIVFFTVGPQDKPLTTIIVGSGLKDKVSKNFVEYFQVDKGTFSVLLNYIQSHDTKMKLNYLNFLKYEFGTYGIVSLNSSNQIKTESLSSFWPISFFKKNKARFNISYVLDNNKVTVLYVKDLIKLLRIKKQFILADNFEELILRRIEFVDSPMSNKR